ncbi:MAG: hypothetical protein AB1646_20090 [Thermodesulfobacteriota bacterium]
MPILIYKSDHRSAKAHNPMNLQEHIQRYIDLQNRANRLFESVKAVHPEAVRCAQGCDECCAVYFDLSLVEAFFLSGMCRDHITAEQRDKVLERAQALVSEFAAAREIIDGTAQTGTIPLETIEDEIAKLKIECPLRNDGSCVLYEYRPITCRLYGVPQKIGERVVCCPKSGFRSGEKFVTVDVDAINRQLRLFSEELLSDLLGETPDSCADMRFSAAKALLTRFDKDFFLGLRGEPRDE